MRFSNVFSLIIGLLITCSMYAQDRSVSGNVIDNDSGLPIPGVTVLEKGTSNGVLTDFDGNFTISNVSDNSILVFSFVGYLSKEVSVSSSSGTMAIQLETDVAQLNEVVVIGYGSEKRKNITGAVSVVSADVIEDLKPARIEQALQGQVAGVNITQQSGAPGSASNIRIRGLGTNGDSRPLILVDGNVIEDLSVLNPGDVESITVLKDAQAAIYGVRGANGVILITTKTGRKNTELQVEFDNYGGLQATTRKLPLLNATEYALIRNEAAAANGEPLVFSDISELGQGTDWQDEVFKRAIIFSNNLNLRGGDEKSAYSFGASLFTQDGIVGGGKTNFTRYTLRGTYNRDLLKNLKLDVNLRYTGSSRRTLPEGGLGSVLFNAINADPTVKPRDEFGNFSRLQNFPIEVVNPLAQINNTFNRAKVDRISGVFGLSYNFLENFTASANYQWNYSEVDSKGFFPITDFGNPGFGNTVFDREIAVVTENENFFRDYTFDAFIEYDNTFNEAHNVKAVLGTSIFKTTGDGFGRTGVGLTATTLDNANVNDSDIITNNFINVSNRLFDSRLLSYFLRAQYNYNEKYFISAMIRRDGSTSFGPENKFGYFPSATAGWIASKEDFLASLDGLDFLKFRASYGIIGNDRIPGFGFVSLLTGEGVYVLDDELQFGVAPGRVSNPEIKWEEQKIANFGVDVNLFNSVDITADYFNRKTEDLLLVVQSSGTLGTSAPGAASPLANAGSIRNSGFEFKIGYKKELAQDVTLDLSYNFATIKNEVLSVNNQVGFEIGGSFGIGQDPPARMVVGQPIGVFFGLETDGIFQTQEEVNAHPSQIELGAMAQAGDIRYKDLNGDGVINSDDRTFIGDPIPDVTMGFNFILNVKNFDFQTYLFASLGNDIVRNYDRNDPRTNQTINVLDRWTGPGTSNTVPRVTTGANTNFIFSDYFVEDGSFVRAQNMQLGYSFPQDKIDGLDKMRFYVAVNNAFTLTKYRGYDPTASNGAPIGGGIDFGVYPIPRTFLIGANFKF